MASAGRRSELQALVFDLQNIQFKPKGASITLYFSLKFMLKNRDLTKSMAHGTSQQSWLVSQILMLLIAQYEHSGITIDT